MKRNELNKLMKNLEKEGMEKVKTKTISQEKVVKIMKEGEKEFVEKVGRLA
jgi:hypothetical protein